MALSHLIKYVYNTGSDEVIRRGKKIHAIGYVEMVEHDELMNSVIFRVKDDTYSTFYKVAIQKYNDPQSLSMRCGCPYNLGDICRHEVAALFKLQELIDKNLLGSSNLQYNQRHTVAKMKNIELKVIRVLAAPESFETAEISVLTNKAKIIVAANERIEAELNYEGQNYPLVIQKNDERNFDTSCRCDETAHPLCIHKTILFLQLLQAYGPYFFDTIRNWDKEKNKLLQIYGYSLIDDLTGKFEFIYKDGKPFLKVLDTNIKRVAAAAPVERASYMHEIPRLQQEVATIENPVKKLGFIFNFNTTAYPYFIIDAIQGDADDDNNKLLGKIEKLDLTKYVNTELLSEDDKILLQQIRKLQSSEVNKYLNRNSPFSGIWENIIQTDGDEFPEETKLLITEYLQPKLKKLFEEQRANPFVYYLPEGKVLKTDNLVEVALSDSFIVPQFKIVAKEDHFELQCRFNINGAAQPVTVNECNNSILFLYNHIFYLWQKAEDVLQAEKFIKNGNIKLSKENWSVQMQKTIMPLTKEYKVEFDKSLVKEIKSGEPEVKLMLQEKGDYLVFQPIFTYQGFETRASDKETITIPDGDKILIVHRNKEAEQRFNDMLSSLHSLFIQPQEGNSLILKGADVLRNNWFFLFVDAMKDAKVPVFGFEALRNFRFNTARPSTHIHVSSGLDWFDAKVEIDFEGQRVGINDIKKALAAKQSFVQLGDGTLGILPDEWLKRYSLLFKVGDGKNDKLRLSKYHMSVIDELYENRDATELSFALDEKFQRLREYKQIPEIVAPSELQAVLRPYQTAGYQWLNYLNEVGWGGILADDMGLGKTVQALTMLQHYKTQEGSLKAIVICPTTLIYNWENEIKNSPQNLPGAYTTVV